MLEEDAHIAVDEILKDLTDRSGFDSAWDACDKQTKQEITQVMYNHIMHALIENVQPKDG